MSSRQRRARRPSIDLRPGSRVLIGAPGVSRPGDWFHAEVLLVDGDEVAIRHIPPSQAPSGTYQRQFVEITHIRAVGEYGALEGFKRQSHKAVEEFSCAVSEAELALGTARSAVWTKLDEIAASGLVDLRVGPVERDAAL